MFPSKLSCSILSAVEVEAAADDRIGVGIYWLRPPILKSYLILKAGACPNQSTLCVVMSQPRLWWKAYDSSEWPHSGGKARCDREGRDVVRNGDNSTQASSSKAMPILVGKLWRRGLRHFNWSALTRSWKHSHFAENDQSKQTEVCVFFFFCYKSGSKMLSRWLVPLCCLLGSPPVSRRWWTVAVMCSWRAALTARPI